MLDQNKKLSVHDIERAIKSDIPVSDGEYQQMRGGVGSALYRTLKQAQEVCFFLPSLCLSLFSHIIQQEKFSTLCDGVGRLPSFQVFLQENYNGVVSLEWAQSSHGSTYESSVIFFDTVFHALESVDSEVICFATDFTHQYSQYGGFGNIWGFVSADPDGRYSLYSFHFPIHSFVGHILPIALGHHSGNESKSTWS